MSGSESSLLQGVSVVEVQHSDEEVMITEEEKRFALKVLSGFKKTK